MGIKLITREVIPQDILDELEEFWAEEYEKDYLS